MKRRNDKIRTHFASSRNRKRRYQPIPLIFQWWYPLLDDELLFGPWLYHRLTCWGVYNDWWRWVPTSVSCNDLLTQAFGILDNISWHIYERASRPDTGNLRTDVRMKRSFMWIHGGYSIYIIIYASFADAVPDHEQCCATPLPPRENWSLSSWFIIMLNKHAVKQAPILWYERIPCSIP